MALNRKIVKFFLLILLSIAFALAPTLLNKERIQLCGSAVTKSSDYLTIYWDTKGDFSEKKSSQVKLNDNIKYFCITSPPLKGQHRIRVDPAQSKTFFTIHNFRIAPYNLIYPLNKIFFYKLEEDTPLVSNTEHTKDISRYDYKSINENPFFIWNISEHTISPSYIFILNWMLFWAIFAISVLFIGSVTFLTRLNRPQNFSTVSLSIAPLFLFVLFSLFALINRHYIELTTYLYFALYFAFFVFALSNILQILFTFNHICIRSTALIVIIFTIAFDIYFHLGNNSKHVFSVKRTSTYHWKIARTASDNLVPSSFSYYSDFGALKNIVRPNEKFFSDVATSYYIAAALPIYMSNAQPHHHKHSMIAIDIVDKICNANNVIELKAILEEEQARITNQGYAFIDYFVLNFDTANKNVTKSCISKNSKKLDSQLAELSKLVFEGEYLKVYRLSYDI